MNLKSLVLATFFVIASSSAHAFTFDRLFWSHTTVGPFTIVTENGGSWVYFSLSDNYAKILIDAHEDAMAFVASNGEVRGARFSQAIKMLKEVAPQLTGSEMELAVEMINAVQAQ